MDHQSGHPCDVLPWQKGDLILSADRKLWVRADDESVEAGYPWGEPPEQWDMARAGGEGSVEDGYVRRPVTLLVRGGKAVAGIEIDDRAIEGEVVHGEIGAGA